MPEPSSGDRVGGRSCHPQPKPRLSLVLTKNDSIGCPLYENIQIGCKTLQDEEKGEEKDSPEKDSNDNMASPNQNHNRGKSTAVRRSTLPVALPLTNNSSIPVSCRNANTLGNKVVNKPTIASRIAIQPSFLHGRGQTVLGSANSHNNTQSSTIKCMPYNSPRLAKSQRLTSTNGVEQNGYKSAAIVEQKKTGSISKPVQPVHPPFTAKTLAKARADRHHSLENLTKTVISNLEPFCAQPFKKQPISWKNRIPTAHRSMDKLLESSSLSCSTDSLLGKENAIRLRSEYRKSASIPPQLVATLASQFNALIEHNQNAHQFNAGRTKMAALVNSRDGQSSIAASVTTVTTSTTVSIRSCPSSPLHSSGLRIGRYQRPRPGNVNGYGKSKVKLSGISKYNGSMATKDGNESSDAETTSKDCVSKTIKEIKSSGITAPSADINVLKDGAGNEQVKEIKFRPTIVQRAVRNYEVALMKSTSSPELPRKKIDLSVDLVPPIVRQSQTLPAATVQPSYELSSSIATGTAHTLPHVDWSAKSTYRRFTKVPMPVNTTIISSKAKDGLKDHKLKTDSAPKTSTDSIASSHNSNESLTTSKPSLDTKIAVQPVPQQRSSILDNTKNGLNDLYQNTSASTGTLQSAKPAIQGAENGTNLFHARPAVIVDRIQVRKLPDIPNSERNSKTDSNGSSMTCIMRSSLRRKAIFDKRSVSSSGDASSTDDIESDHSSGSKGSMDLLAEIDNHPRLLAAVESATNLWSTISARTAKLADSGGECIARPTTMFKAPNASFLWKPSTQDKVSRESSKSSLLGAGNERNSILYDDDEEHLYEELANCISRPIPSPPPREDIPLPLPNLDEHTMIENAGPHEVVNYSLTRRSLESRTTSSHEKLPDDYLDYSDGSWTDESDTNNEANEVQFRSKVKHKGKRQSNRKDLTRRSWSQSLRDLAESQDSVGKEQVESDATGYWEDEFGSDGSSEQVYTAPAQGDKTKKHVGHTDSITTDTDSDKSPTSVNGGSVSDVNQTDADGKGHKGKRVKRNWSWSKTDFRLDLTSKLGKIRMNKKTTTEICVETSSIDASPTKKKQWPFKGKSSQKKTNNVSPKQSPKKESAQFYVPTFNFDGSLASPPGNMANLDIQFPTSTAATVSNITTQEVNVSTRPASSSCASTAAVKKARRISSGGTVSRPKTAPPAPPISSIKFAHSKSSAPCSTSSELSSDSFSEQDGTSSNLYKPVQQMNSNQSESSSIRYSSNDLIKIGASSYTHSTSNVSSDSELVGAVVNRPSTRGSIASSYSNSSGESYSRIEDVPTIPGAQGELMNRFLQTQPTIQESESDGSTLGGTGKRGFLYLDDTYYIDDTRYNKLSPFEDEPLYQFYNINAQQRAAQENQVEGSDDDYESLYRFAPSEASSTATVTSIPSAMDLVKSTEGGVRTLWCEVPEVIASGILETVSPQERKLQEAMFEVITSEASYLKSLNVLINVFMKCPLFMDDYSMDCVLNKREKHVLFSDVLPVRETSERLLAALEERWQENILLSDICDILQDHATKYFEVYVKYCSNQIYQDRCLKTLKESNPQFMELLRNLESRSECQSLSMHSFLMLPMQRITRLPLLVDAIFNRLEHGTKQFESSKQALMTLNKIVHECNEGAARMARMEEMLNISRLLDFREFKGIALISASRWLVKKGDLTRLLFCDPSKLSFGRRCTKQIVYLFLFTDLLIITKKKSDDCYNVVDYCPRNMVQVTEIETVEQLPDRPPDGCKNVFQLSMLQNHDNKTVEMFFCCPMESDRTRWMEAVTPKKSENPDERIYEEWDCPQVQAIHSYVAQQPDELSLEESDVVNVFCKTADGWYQGERIRDGIQGWFPSNYTVEIVSSHVRARNLRQRYRLLALSHSYLEEQKKKENKVK